MLQVTVVSNTDDANNHLMAIAYHYAGDVDVADVKDLQKSALFDIRKGPQTLIIRANDDFLSEVTSGRHRLTNYSLLLVPRSIEKDSITTLRNLATVGGKVLWSGSGPP